MTRCSARRCPITAVETISAILPRTPYRGIEPFLYGDHPIFFARDDEVRQLLRHVVVYRGVFLYGESGAGKSSLINAGLVPAATEEGFRPDRVRVQPRPGQELVVERMPLSADGDVFLPTSFSNANNGSPIVFSVEAFRSRVGAVTEESRPLLIFDQFEELITLFDEALEGDALVKGRRCQASVVDLMVELLRDETLPLKLLFVFREDYLAKVQKLLAARPELVDRSVRLTPPETDALYRIIRGPFDDHPDHFERELSPRLAERLSAEIASRASAGAINLSEVQIACLRLWQSEDPEALLAEKGVQGILEEYLEESLNRFPEDLHYPAVALLSQLVTATGARNVVSADDLVERVRAEEQDVPEDRLRAALAALEREAKLVRRERRRDLDLYEIVSEFLSPWIRRQREQRLKDRELSRRLKRAGLGVGALGAAVAAAFAVAAGIFWLRADHRASVEKADAEAALVFQDLAVDPEHALQLAVSAIGHADTVQAEAALRAALAQPEELAVLDAGQGPLEGAAFSADGKRVLTFGGDHKVRTWDVATRRQVRPPFRFTRYPKPAAYSRRGQRVVRTTPDFTARVSDASSGSLISVLPGYPSPVGSVAFGPTNDLVVAASADGTARVWRVPVPSTRVLGGLTGSVVSAAFSPDGKRVVTSGADGSRSTWDAASGRLLRSVHARSRAFPPPKLSSPDGRLRLTPSVNAVLVTDTATGKVLANLPSHGPTSAAFSADGRLIATAGFNGEVRVWQALAGRLVTTLQRRWAGVEGAVFSPDGSRLVLFGSNGAAIQRCDVCAPVAALEAAAKRRLGHIS